MSPKSILVIESRPQVSVEVNDFGDITISVASIAPDFRSVENNEITFPAECAKAVAKAILEALKK